MAQSRNVHNRMKVLEKFWKTHTKKGNVDHHVALFKVAIKYW